MSRYAIGVDVGSESGRAVLVDVADGRQVATAVCPYSNGVIDERLPLPDRDVRLAPDWALQDPEDHLRVFQVAVPAVLRESGVDSDDVIGLGVDFAACTMLPTTADGTPLCLLPELRANPHAWLTLWKHHAAQPEADRINETAARTDQAWLPRWTRNPTTAGCAGPWLGHVRRGGRGRRRRWLGDDRGRKPGDGPPLGPGLRAERREPRNLRRAPRVPAPAPTTSDPARTTS